MLHDDMKTRAAASKESAEPKEPFRSVKGKAGKGLRVKSTRALAGMLIEVRYSQEGTKNLYFADRSVASEEKPKDTASPAESHEPPACKKKKTSEDALTTEEPKQRPKAKKSKPSRVQISLDESHLHGPFNFADHRKLSRANSSSQSSSGRMTRVCLNVHI